MSSLPVSNELLRNKKVFITGASRGIGLAIAESFAMAGAELHLNALNEAYLLAQVQRIQQNYDVPVFMHVFDVSDPQAVKLAFQSFQKNHKSLDVLVNNAGVMLNGLLSMTTEKALEKIFSTNVYGSMYCAQYASRIMSRKNQGVIINLASFVGSHGYSGQSAYASSKAAIEGLTKSWSKEFAGVGIRVNAISPGMIDTDLLHSLGEDDLQKNLDNIALKRLGLPKEVAQVALFLASNMSSYMTGQILAVDGGMQG